MVSTDRGGFDHATLNSPPGRLSQLFLSFEDVAASLSIDALAGCLVFCSFGMHCQEFVRGSSLFRQRSLCRFGRSGHLATAGLLARCCGGPISGYCVSPSCLERRCSSVSPELG